MSERAKDILACCLLAPFLPLALPLFAIGACLWAVIWACERVTRNL